MKACLGRRKWCQSGNVFRHTGETPIVEGGVVIAEDKDVGWSTGCSHCLITSNVIGVANDINVDTSPERSNQLANNH